MLQGNSVLNKWPSLCLSFMLEHIPFLPWTWGWLLKADGSFSKCLRDWSLSFVCDQEQADDPVPLVLTTVDYICLSNFLAYSLRWSKTPLPKPCPHSPHDSALTQTRIWTSPSSLLACCFLISASPRLNLSAVPNVLPTWLITWLITTAHCSLWFLLLSQTCISFPSYLQPLWLVH